MKRILLYLLLAVLAHLTMIGQQTQQTLTIYPDATETNIYVPMHPSDFDSYTRSQYVVPADALETMYGATITSLKYYTTDDGIPYTAPCTLDVYLKEVSYTSISSFEPKANCTIVYTGTLNFGYYGSGGEVTITFSTPYVYNGGNLLVGIENTTTTYGYETSWIHFYGQTVTGASVGNFHNNLNGISPTQRNFIPKTTFTYTPDNCPKPNNLEASDITTSSATLSWTPKGEETSWDVQYRMVGATNWIDKGTVNTTPASALDNLEEYTEYQFRVKPNCTEGANWTDPYTFRTLSSVVTIDEDHPYSTGFEGETLDWYFLNGSQNTMFGYGETPSKTAETSRCISPTTAVQTTIITLIVFRSVLPSSPSTLRQAITTRRSTGETKARAIVTSFVLPWHPLLLHLLRANTLATTFITPCPPIGLPSMADTGFRPIALGSRKVLSSK